jgi:hypothetical protein
VYIFDRDPEDPSGWEEVAKISQPDGELVRYFGQHLAIRGTTLVVGCENACTQYSDMQYVLCEAGAVYIYDRNQGGSGKWGLVKKLITDGSADHFGSSVSIDGDLLVVGSRGFGTTTGHGGPGRAFVFHRNEGGVDNWGQVAGLVGSDTEDGDHFGSAVSINVGSIIVGALRNDDACPGDPDCRSGSAYIFERNHGGPNNWGEVKKLSPGDLVQGDHFGVSAVIDGDTVVVGSQAPSYRHLAGAAHIFQRDFGGVDNWGRVAELSNPGTNGELLALSGDVGLTTDTAATVVLARNRVRGANWGEVTRLSRRTGWSENVSVGHVSGGYPTSFAIGNDFFVIGATSAVQAVDGIRRGENVGAVYVFTINPSDPDRIQRPPRRPIRRVMPAPMESEIIASTTLGDHAYELRKGVDFRWRDARNACAVEGKYLASIHSQEENDLLASLIESADDQLDPARDHAAWIGLTDEDEEGAWLWVTGEPLTYENWRSGEPNNAHGGEHFAVMYTPYWGEFGYWNDVTPRDLFTLFFCETGEFLQGQKLKPNPKRTVRGAW